MRTAPGETAKNNPVARQFTQQEVTNTELPSARWTRLLIWMTARKS